FGAERGKDRFPSEARFFLRADHFQTDFCFLPDEANKCVPIFCFARCAGSDGAVARHAKFFHHFLKVSEGFDSLLENLFAEAMTNENAFAKTQRIALVVKRFEVNGGMGADYRKADCV